MRLSLGALVNTATRGILPGRADRRPAPPGPEKSTAQIYGSTLDWLAHIWTPINRCAPPLMPPRGSARVDGIQLKKQAARGEDGDTLVGGGQGDASSCFTSMRKRSCFISGYNQTSTAEGGGTPPLCLVPYMSHPYQSSRKQAGCAIRMNKSPPE